MASRMYRSASGKPIDMGQLLLKNENVRAVGNMGVNAKGDKIDKVNNVVESKNRQVHKEYKKQILNTVVDVPPQSSSVKVPVQEPIVEEKIEEVVGLDDDDKTIDLNQVNQSSEESVVEEPVTVEEMDQTVKETAVQNFKQSVVEEVVEKESVIEEVAEEPVVATPKTTKKKSTGGLASAIAKAREIKQEKLQTEKEKAKSTKGVKKI